MFFEKLKLFKELVVVGNFSKLAENNNLSLSYVSRKISSLEDEIGHKLIVRNFKAGPIILTHPGNVLYKSLPKLLSTYDAIQNLMCDDSTLNAGIIDIYTTASIIEDWLVPMLPTFKEQLRDTKLNFITEDYLIERDTRDSIISITPYDENNQDLIQVPLLDFKSCLWASSQYIKRFGTPETIEDLKRHQFLSFTKQFNHTSYPTINWHIKKANIPYDNIICINTTEGLVRATNAGLGILSLSQESVAAKDYQFTRILPDFQGPVVKMCFCFPEYWKDNELLNKVAKMLQAFFKYRNADNLKKLTN